MEIWKRICSCVSFAPRWGLSFLRRGSGAAFLHTKAADLNSEISGKSSGRKSAPAGCNREIARRCTYHTQRKSCGNTGLLTCVREQMLLRPHPTFSQVFPAMADICPGDSIASAWPRAHSTVSCRHNAFFLAAPAGGRQSGVYYGIYSVFGEAERAASDAFIAPYIISERGVFCKRIFGQLPLRRLFQVGRVNLPGRWGRRRRNTDRGAVGTAFPWA